MTMNANIEAGTKCKSHHHNRERTITMKIISCVVLFAGTVSALPTLNKIRRESAHKRMLEVSEQCLSDFEALQDTPALSSALSTWRKEVKALKEDCLSGLSDITTPLDCPLDSATVDSHEALLAACEEVGGTNLLWNYVISCPFSLGGIDLGLDIDYMNIPDCLPPSCIDALEEWTDIKAPYVNDLALSFVNELPMGAQCTGTLGESTLLGSTGGPAQTPEPTPEPSTPSGTPPPSDPGTDRTETDPTSSVSGNNLNASFGALSILMVAIISFVI